MDDTSTDDAAERTGQLALNLRDLEASANRAARAISGAFTAGVVDGRRFEDVLKSLTLRLSDMAVRLAFRPLEQSLASGLRSLLNGLVGTGTGTGGGAAGAARAQAFADGGVISSPAFFTLGRNRLGLAGEAGAEAILPLKRGPDGALGVAVEKSGGASITVNIATPDAESFRRSEAYVAGLIARAVSRGQRAL